MNIAILIYPETWFHCVLGLIDSLPINIHIDAYVCNEHDWVGLLKQSYQNGIRNTIREFFQILNIDNFNIENQYDYVVYSNKENMIKHEKSIYLRDWLPIPITDKLFPHALENFNQKQIIGVVGNPREPLHQLKDSQRFVFINFVGSTNFSGEHFHLESDAFYLQVASCDFLFPTDLSDELSIVCKVPLLFPSNQQSILSLPPMIEKTRRFETIHLVNDNPLTIWNPKIFDKSAKKWESLGYNVKIWNFDDLVQLAKNETEYNEFETKNFFQKLVVFQEAGIVANPYFIPLQHDGYWEILGDEIGDEIMNNVMIGSIFPKNPKIWDANTNFTNLDLMIEYEKEEELSQTNQYQPWVIVLTCILVFLLFCFFAFLRKNIHFLKNASAHKMFLYKSDWK
jgi:hypothetical protein